MTTRTNFTLITGRRTRLPGWASLMAIFVAASAMFYGSRANLARAAEQEAESEAVQAGQEAFSKQPAVPWYDPKTDDLRRIDLAPPEPVKQQKPSQTPSSSNQSTNGNGSGNGGSGSSSAPIPPMPSAVSDSVQWFAWLLIALVLAVLAYLLISAFLSRENKAAVSGDTTDDDEKPCGDRVEALPFQVRRAHGDFLDEARHHYEQGNYREAIIYLYSYQLLQLDKNQLIRLEKGKTNRQYLGEARRQQPLGNLLEGTMVAFEDVFFGDHAIDRERFEHCWTQVPQFNQLVQQVAA